MSIEFIFSEFGSRSNANQPDSFTDEFRLDPTYSSVKQYFPEAKLTLYTDIKELGKNYPDVEIKLIDIDKSPFTKSNHRWGWHCCDYYEAKGLLNSTADIAISVDSDLMFVSDEVRTILPMVQKFGICVPTNIRQLVKVDGIYTKGNDGDYHLDEDESKGNLLTYDLWWAGFNTKDKRARDWLSEFCRLMETNPKRAPLQMSRAAWNTGIYPYSMPSQFGVGNGYIGCGNEIILHLGHLEVQDYYLERRL
mgnify:FL=1|jgi:hypothetical protein|tara:strand:+ start:4889 stop:5638 length:750 start_codon:yes stop_codon:yes gene_type:complete